VRERARPGAREGGEQRALGRRSVGREVMSNEPKLTKQGGDGWRFSGRHPAEVAGGGVIQP
jgi:hypothetical protein